MLLTLPDGRRAHLTEHAIDRWAEYVCPLASGLQAVRLLQLVVDLAGELRADPPEWVRPPHEDGVTGWLVAGDFALVLAGKPSKRRVVTVVPRGSLPTSARLARNRQNRITRQRRAAQRRGRDREARAEHRAGRAPVVEAAV